MGKFLLTLLAVLAVLGVMLALVLLGGCAPAAPVPEAAPDSAGAVTISVECGFASAGGVAGAPDDGVIVAKTVAPISDGDTMWDVLRRVCRESGVVVAKNGSGKSVFVKSIGGVAPVSGQSGWMFRINGEFVMASAGNIPMSDGDVVEWVYTMDGGDDVKQEL